ncbi:chromosome segregation SMC family protein [Bifidobacterium crudilactis]|jgi:chromosome segregation protein|uniref:chromosome segregation SMC family protein n=1 Tax=Bifidobacterium crudilactis TaxID=327277 RepID=UPI002F359B32|nr:AAA family ATPase [Bifidobacterium crudilactis]
MYLKELTLRGFKSFASATTLRFEPGITAVVGPNGSGKSNIVDALAWVMGEQGAKSLRGTSMEDVIFAGTSSRPPLGRAQVSLTIDNGDHVLDIDYTEVTISRTIFRNGGSEYAINGSSCRLLDIQELLSDTGLGQQMHVIVGQGRLDSILRADPAGHRAFIEEAAGILKHRKRKERALRKLANTETNLSRLDDLLSEIHRQLGPLGRQARISRRAEGIQVTLRDAQARIQAEDALKLTQQRDKVRNELGTVRASLMEAQRELTQAKMRIEQVEALSSQSNPEITGINNAWHELSRLQERFRSLASLAEERASSLSARITAVGGEDPGMLLSRAQELEQQHEAQSNKVSTLKQGLEQATEQRAGNEKKLASVRQTLTELRRLARARDTQISNLRELIAKEESAVQLSESRHSDFTGQIENLDTQLKEAGDQQNSLSIELTSLGDEDSNALQLAKDRLDGAQTKLNELNDQLHDVNSRMITLQAKADALADTLQSRNATGALEQDPQVAPLGRLADFIRITEGWEEPVAHALDAFSSALVVPGGGNMLHALLRAREDHLGKAVVLRPMHAAGAVAKKAVQSPPEDAVGEQVRALSTLVTLNPQHQDDEQAQGVLASVHSILDGVAACDDTRQAYQAVDEGHWRRAVSRSGDVITAVGAVGGSSQPQSDLSLAARRDSALAQSTELGEQAKALQADILVAQQARDQARATVDAERNLHTERRVQRQQLEKSLHTAQQRVSAVEHLIEQATRKMAEAEEDGQTHRQKAHDLAQALASAQHSEGGASDFDELTHREHGLETALNTAREHEVAAKIAWNEARGTAESLARQADVLRSNAKEAQERRIRTEQANDRHRADAAHARRLAGQAHQVQSLMADSLARAAKRREALQAQISTHDDELKRLRQERNAVEPKVASLQDREHQLDIDRERLATQLGQLLQQLNDGLGIGIPELIDTYGPDQPVPVLDDSGQVLLEDVEGGDAGAVAPGDGTVTEGTVDGGEPDGAAGRMVESERYRTVPYNRQEQVKRLEKARRDLQALGKVNPLATEEFDALQTRNQYLNEQRNDVATSRDDLLGLVKDLDTTMIDVFKQAFDDTAVAFGTVFNTLFPGGTGRLRLEDPDDLLHSGVIVEASPAGKRVKQLTLLSGGERSLTALALLFAIFTARPSPFYVMDEVEAALDDVNLTRLLNALNDLRSHAQLIVITHQQRTMSIADALYGITMRSDGVTAVVSQKMERS